MMNAVVSMYIWSSYPLAVLRTAPADLLRCQPITCNSIINTQQRSARWKCLPLGLGCVLAPGGRQKSVCLMFFSANYMRCTRICTTRLLRHRMCCTYASFFTSLVNSSSSSSSSLPTAGANMQADRIALLIFTQYNADNTPRERIQHVRLECERQ